jgi:hypothetical protein
MEKLVSCEVLENLRNEEDTLIEGIRKERKGK